MCTSRYIHCRALMRPQRKCKLAKDFVNEGSLVADTLTDSSNKGVLTCHVGVVANAAVTRRCRSAAAPLDVDRRTGADDGYEGFVLERTFHFDASADR